MEAVVNHALGNVHCARAILCLNFVAEYYLMHAGAGVRKIEDVFQSFADIVGIQDGVFSRLTQPVRSVRLNVGEGAHEHAEVAIEGANPTDGLRTVVVESERSVGFRNHYWLWQKWFQAILHCNRTGPWPAT